MEKSTSKFLSVLLSLAMVMCFPVVASANTAYDETFKGTYIAPESATNVLISGDDATVTEWYGDRVNAGSHTYSVRQNQYGLNKDGNMIEAKTNTKYTLWLAQYGVASLKFVVPEDGQYVIQSSKNEKYSNDNQPYMKDFAYYGHGNEIRALYSNQYKNAEADYGWTVVDDDKMCYETVVTKKFYKGDVIYITASTSRTSLPSTQNLLDNGRSYFYDSWPKDMVYDVEIINKNDITTKNCKHAIYSESDDSTKIDCVRTYPLQCDLCGTKFTKQEEAHDWEYKETVISGPEEIKCDETHVVKAEWYCADCGKVDPTDHYQYTVYGGHNLIESTKQLLKEGVDYENDFDSEYCYSVDYHNSVLYKGTCADCGKTAVVSEDTPCYTENGVKHDYGVDEDSIDCKHPATCKVCGHIAKPHKYPTEKTYWGTKTKYTYSDYKNSDCTKVDLACEVCGYQKYSYVEHEKVRFVQVTPQHDNVCGTYKLHCDECNTDITSVLTCHSYYTVKNEDGTTTKKCARCGQLYKNENTNPGGSSGSGSSSGSTGGGAPETSEEKPTETPETNPMTPPTTLYSKPAQVVVNKPQAKEKAVVVTWKKAKNVSGYEVQLATDKKFKKNKKKVNVKKPNASKKTVKKLKKNKKYYVRVRSYKIVNGKKVYGKWSKVKSVKTK